MGTDDGLVAISVGMRRMRESITIALHTVHNPELWAIVNTGWPEYPNRRELSLPNAMDWHSISAGM
jgi:hypothetical protein